MNRREIPKEWAIRPLSHLSCFPQHSRPLVPNSSHSSGQEPMQWGTDYSSEARLVVSRLHNHTFRRGSEFWVLNQFHLGFAILGTAITKFRACPGALPRAHRWRVVASPFSWFLCRSLFAERPLPADWPSCTTPEQRLWNCSRPASSPDSTDQPQCPADRQNGPRQTDSIDLVFSPRSSPTRPRCKFHRPARAVRAFGTVLS